MEMKRTISGMIGKGSIAHNERKFIAENVDASRMCIVYIDYSLCRYQIISYVFRKTRSLQYRNWN